MRRRVHSVLSVRIHRHRQPDEGIRTFLDEAPCPGRDRERGHEEGPGGLSKGPPAGGPKFEDSQSCRRWIIKPPVRLDLLHPGVLDADFLARE